MDVSSAEVNAEVVDVVIKSVVKGYHECSFQVEVGEIFTASKKHGEKGRAFKVHDVRGQLGHLERRLVAPLWRFSNDLKWYVRTFVLFLTYGNKYVKNTPNGMCINVNSSNLNYKRKRDYNRMCFVVVQFSFCGCFTAGIIHFKNR